MTALELTDEEVQSVKCRGCDATGTSEIWPYDGPPVASSCGDCDGIGIDRDALYELISVKCEASLAAGARIAIDLAKAETPEDAMKVWQLAREALKT